MYEWAIYKITSSTFLFLWSHICSLLLNGLYIDYVVWPFMENQKSIKNDRNSKRGDWKREIEMGKSTWLYIAKRTELNSANDKAIARVHVSKSNEPMLTMLTIYSNHLQSIDILLMFLQNWSHINLTYTRQMERK